jgi:hypothetical protein
MLVIDSQVRIVATMYVEVIEELVYVDITILGRQSRIR